RTTRIWDPASGKELRQLQPEAVRQKSSDLLAISPDGKTLAALDWDVSVRFWEIATGNERAAYGKALPRPAALSFSPDGRLLAEGGHDGALTIRELPSLKELARRAAHQAQLQSLTFSADGKFLVSTSKDCTALVWDVNHLTKRPPRLSRSLKKEELL